MNELFYELIRVSIGTQESLSRLPSESEWEVLYAMAVKQSLVGICFIGLGNLGADNDDGYARIGMTEELFFNWMGMAAQINLRNEAMDGYTKDALSFFRNLNLQCIVLKGQGLAGLYGSLQGSRQSGDVDVWLKISRKDLYALSRSEFGEVKGITYHHIHCPIFKDCEVEAHLHPSFLSSPRRNKALKKFCLLYEPGEGSEDTPSLAFNRVYILLHCYRHFCGHGIGLRQLLDYFFVLHQGFTEEEKAESMEWISALGMKRFAMAAMWLMKDVLGLDECYLLCEPSDEYGQFLLGEVMKSGNFGHGNKEDRISGSAVKRFLYNIRRDMRTLRICPHEALWDPVFNVYQFLMTKFVWNKSYYGKK